MPVTRMKWRTTACLVAPSATRMPISRVCRATRNAMTPASPSAHRMSDTPPPAVKSRVLLPRVIQRALRWAGDRRRGLVQESGDLGIAAMLARTISTRRSFLAEICARRLHIGRAPSRSAPPPRSLDAAFPGQHGNHAHRGHRARRRRVLPRRMSGARWAAGGIAVMFAANAVTAVRSWMDSRYALHVRRCAAGRSSATA